MVKRAMMRDLTVLSLQEEGDVPLLTPLSLAAAALLTSGFPPSFPATDSVGTGGGGAGGGGPLYPSGRAFAAKRG